MVAVRVVLGSRSCGRHRLLALCAGARPAVRRQIAADKPHGGDLANSWQNLKLGLVILAMSLSRPIYNWH
jgi:hypothetical protein